MDVVCNYNLYALPKVLQIEQPMYTKKAGAGQTNHADQLDFVFKHLAKHPVILSTVWPGSDDSLDFFPAFTT